MPRSHAEKLLTSLPKVAGSSRRQQFSASTKRALVEVATRQFSEHGYGGTSLDAIVAGAQVTKGALYHHFSGKQAIFEAVFERVQSRAAMLVREAAPAGGDTADGTADEAGDVAAAGLRAFVDAVRRPAYQRVVVQDGPSV